MVGKSHYRVRGVHCGKCERVHTWYKYRVWREGKKLKEEYIGKCDQYGNASTKRSQQRDHHRTGYTSWREDFQSWQRHYSQYRSKRSPYEVLGVHYSSTRAEINRAYRKLVKQYHPDLNKHIDPRIIVEINVAYQTLTT